MNTYYSEIIKSNCYFSAPVNYKSCKNNESFKTYLELDHQFKKQIILLIGGGTQIIVKMFYYSKPAKSDTLVSVLNKFKIESLNTEQLS